VLNINQNYKVQHVGNTTEKKTQCRSVYLTKGISPTLLAGMSHGNTVPYIIIEDNEKQTKEKE
jgi:hypothetical protein